MEKTAIDLLQSDVAFRARASSAANEAVSEYHKEFCGGQDFMRLTHDVAFYAAGIALKRAFDEDSEISRLRAENEHLKASYLNLVKLTPPVSIFCERGSLNDKPL